MCIITGKYGDFYRKETTQIMTWRTKGLLQKVDVNFKPCLWVFLCYSLCVLQHFIIGAHVSLGPWLGTVTEVYRRVVIMLKNGSRYSNLIMQTQVLNQ